MSCPDRLPAAPAAGVLVLALAGGPAGAEDAAGECRSPEGRVLAPVDCAEYLQQLDLEAKRLELVAKMEELKANAAGAAKRRLEAERGPAAPLPPLPPASSPPPAAPAPGRPSAAPNLPDRVLEITGGQARIRYQGGVYLVQAGTRLPSGGQVTQVTLAGVDLMDGKERRHLPFVLGEWR